MLFRFRQLFEILYCIRIIQRRFGIRIKYSKQSWEQPHKTFKYKKDAQSKFRKSHLDSDDCLTKFQYVGNKYCYSYIDLIITL